MKLITTKNIAWGAFAALVLSAVIALPAPAHAWDGGCGYGCGGVSYINPFGTPIVDYYGYNRPQSVYSQTPVVIQSQPIVVPQPVVVQQPVIQQPIVYNTPVYNPPTYYPISVSCSANATYSQTGQTVTWTAYVSGGYNNSYYNNGYNNGYSYSWSGTEGLYGSGQTAYITYSTPGSKYASVTVYANGQTYTQNCTNSVTVQGYYPVYQPPVIAQPVPVQPVPVVAVPRLDIACYADPVKAIPNQPTTWTAEVTGGLAPYTYSWTGSDGLTGSGRSIIKYYSTGGTKSAVVTVTSADGLSESHACSNTLAVAYPYHAVAKTPVPAPVAQATSSTNNTAATIFSLANVPWGWIAIIIMLVLFFTIIYLLFNRSKI